MIRTLKTKLTVAFVAVILFLGAAILALGFYVIKKDIIDTAQHQVRRDLDTAGAMFQNAINKIRNDFALVSDPRDFLGRRHDLGVDYVIFADKEEAPQVRSEIARKAVTQMHDLGGTRLISAEELKAIAPELMESALLKIRPTPKARPLNKEKLDAVLALEYAVLVYDENSRYCGVVYAGKIINNRFSLVDSIRNLVFENRRYNNKAVGTVTIFQDDVRVSTNVLDSQGGRAVGTRVSAEVYNQIFNNKRMWVDRAFVVTDWYLTAYEPITDINGKVIGILYVGILEQPFRDKERRLFLAFLLIIVVAVVFAAAISLALAQMITHPLEEVLKGASQLSLGDLQYRVKGNSGSVLEMRRLRDAFNSMAHKLDAREQSLRVTNDKLATLNKNYLDLVGFVSHELKGILSSLVLNIYNLHKELLGPMNESQKKTLSSVSRNLDYLNATVVNFLNLSRIEKDELVLKKHKLSIKEDIFNVAAESFAQLAQEKQISVLINMPDAMTVEADRDLLLIAANNLLSNAIKYGRSKGKIEVTAKENDGFTEVEVYNDGRPIATIDTDKLFKKFSRLHYAGVEKTKGTGIGLFITRRIIEQHGGTILVKPKDEGNSFIFTIKK